MKNVLLTTLFLVFVNPSFGQRFYNIAFDELPQNYQLYPRNEKNEAIVPINGRIEIGEWSYMSVVVYRNKKLYGYYRNAFSYDSTGKIGTFSLKPLIKAELAEYDFQIYASQAGKDSVLTFERKNIVSGDAYLIYGQSNGRAWEEKYEYQNEYCRTFGFGSFQHGYTWGLSNSDYTGGFEGEQFIVGEWGIEFQRHISENYGIPTCVINASTSGANIKTLSDRNTNNIADIETHYGRLIYMAQKSGIINNVKGFFYWQAETDAAQIPSLWKPGFDQMYKFWEKDLPSVKKIYTFQIPLFGAGDYNDEVGVLRDYLRQLGSFYPKITTYAPLGVTGWNGWHFNLDGYKQIAKELSIMVGKDFYGEKKLLFSPNIQKTYYSSANRDEITLAFESGQQMLYPKDTIAPNIGGGFGTYSVKDFFYINKEWQKVASGRAEGNRIILKLKQPAAITDSLIKYLPSIYPYSGGSYLLHEAPWIYIGPFLKNYDGMRAFAFHNLKIAPYREFENLNLTNTLNEGKKISLKWNNITNIKGYILERISAKDSTDIQLVTQLSNTITTFTDTSVALGKEYIYRIKAITDLQESFFSTLKIKTSNDPSILWVSSQVNYYNSVFINWIASTTNVSPDFYTIERKININGTFEQISKVSGNVLTYKDTTVKANTSYLYRITTSGGNLVIQGQIDVTTPDLLTTPELSSAILFYNSLKINWKAVIGANLYKIERKSGTEDFKQISILEAKNTEWIDNNLSANTEYTYRLKALGDKTESLENTISVTTSAILSTPEIMADFISHESVQLKWKVIANATKYILERQAAGENTFTKILEDNLLEFIDTKLKSNLTYSYRLKTLSNISESGYAKISVKTLAILANQNEENDSVKIYPNPVKDKLTISFLEPTTGDISIMNLLGRNILEVKILKQKLITMDVSNIQKGIYFVIFKINESVYSHKIWVE